MSIADYGATQWASVMFGLASLPTDFYLALCTAEPGAGWDGAALASVEPSDAAYARQQIVVPTGFAVSDDGYVTNAAQLTFPAPTADWGTITHYALVDALTGGNLWLYEAFLDEITVTVTVPPIIDANSVFVALRDQNVSIEG